MAHLMLLVIFLNSTPCQENLFLPDEINDRELIAIASIDKEFDSKAIEQGLTGLRLTEIFKGSGNMLIAIDQGKFYFEEGKSYLIFANYEDSAKSRKPYISDCSKSRLLSEVDFESIKYLRNHLGTLQCHDVDLLEKMQKTACERYYEPVCGCDGVTYGNLCEMQKKGIRLYSHNACK